MSKTFRKLLAVLLVLSVTLTFSAVPSFAAEDDTLESGEYMVKVESSLGMLSQESPAKLTVDGENATLTLICGGTAFTRYYQIYVGKYADITEENKDTIGIDGVAGDSTITFTLPLKTADLTSPIHYVLRYKKGYSADHDGDWYKATSGDDYYLTLSDFFKLETVELAVTNNVGMFLPGNVAGLKITSENEGLLTLNMESDSFSKVKSGDVEINVDGRTFADIPVVTDGSVNVLEFWSVNKQEYYKRDLTIDLEEKTATFDPHVATIDELEGLTDEEAMEFVKANANVDLCNELIEAIQVQERYDDTDLYCALAKACWDALDADDKLEDDGYFSEDTGDASLDDPLNTAPDKEKELLVVSFGTSFNDSRVATIGAVEKALAAAYGDDYAVRRAFTAQIIINHVQARDGEKIDNVAQAMDKAVAAGVKEMIVQPTHLMSGAEFDELKGEIDKYADKINITYGKPLLNSDEDKEAVAKALVEAAYKDAGYETLEAADAAKVAFVFMGHGTAHEANVTYTQMQSTMDKLGYANCFVGTVEGNPPATALPEVKKALEAKGYTKVVLRPMMVVAGDHANNDMAADEEGSWYYAFVNGGEFEVEGQDAPVNIGAGFGAENVTCQIKGLGEIPAIQQMYVEHAAAAKEEPVEEVIELAITNNVGMFKPGTVAGLKITGENEGLLTLNMESDSFNKVKSGDVEINVDGRKFADIPVITDGSVNVLEFWSVKNQQYYKRDLIIDVENKTATFNTHVDPIDALDGLTYDETVAKAAELASPELMDNIIEAIQVQVRTEDTDRYCAAAKACWDALTDEQKEEVDDPDYMGLDTGDASKDDPLNTAPDKDKELLVVSFGTSFNDSRVATIGGVEKALAKAYGEDYAVRRAFTAQIIINHVQARDGEKIDNVDQAMEKAVAAGVKEMIVQPTHLMSGAEYDELKGQIDAYADKINIAYAKPLLNSDEDKEAVAKAVVEAAVKDAGYESLAAADAAKVAFVFMGHGTAHEANVTYTQMQQTMDNLGYNNCFIGTVEGIPEATALAEVKKAVVAKGYTKVILRPLMVVAGDHANNDMAADEEGSWYYGFAVGGMMEVEGEDEPVDLGEGFGKENVDCQINGLGEIEAIQQMYVDHTFAVLPAADPIKVTLTVSLAGKLAEDNEGNVMALREVTVEDLDKSGDFSTAEALVAAHKTYNKEDGFVYAGDWVTTLWGIETNATSFTVNDKALPNGVETDKVQDGDYVVVSTYVDTTGWSDWYTFFDKRITTVEYGNDVTLTLLGHAAWDSNSEGVAAPGVEVKTLDGKTIGTTDEKGQVTFKAEALGEVILTAEGTTTQTGYDGNPVDCPIVAPAAKLTVEQADISKATIAKVAAKTYTGKAITPAPAVKYNGKTLKKGTDYTVSYKNNKNAGKATITFKGTGNFKGTATKTFTINKAKNTLKVTAKKKTFTVKYAKLKKANQTLKRTTVLSISKKQGTLTYKKTKGNSKITVAKKTGKITIKKGLKKGTYTVKIKVTASGNKNYKKGSKTVTFKIKVK